MDEIPQQSASPRGAGGVWAGRLLVGAIVLAVLALFHVWGNSHDPRVYTSSAFTWTWMFWTYSDGFGGAIYWQGWVVLAATALLIWRQRDALRAVQTRPDAWGLAVIALGFFLHWVAMRSQQTRLSLIALDLILWGVALRLGGRQIAYLLLFPAVFLLLAVPLNFFDSVMFPLRIVCTMTASGLLNGLGIKAASSGSVIGIEGSAPYTFEVADAHSSIHGMLSLVIAGALLAHLTQKVWWKQAVVFVSAGAAALLAVVIRTLVLALVAQGIGPGAADWLRTSAGGILYYALALSLLGLVVVFLRRPPQQRRLHELP